MASRFQPTSLNDTPTELGGSWSTGVHKKVARFLTSYALLSCLFLFLSFYLRHMLYLHDHPPTVEENWILSLCTFVLRYVCPLYLAWKILFTITEKIGHDLNEILWVSLLAVAGSIGVYEVFINNFPLQGDLDAGIRAIGISFLICVATVFFAESVMGYLEQPKTPIVKMPITGTVFFLSLLTGSFIGFTIPGEHLTHSYSKIIPVDERIYEGAWVTLDRSVGYVIESEADHDVYAIRFTNGVRKMLPGSALKKLTYQPQIEGAEHILQYWVNAQSPYKEGTLVKSVRGGYLGMVRKVNLDGETIVVDWENNSSRRLIAKFEEVESVPPPKPKSPIVLADTSPVEPAPPQPKPPPTLRIRREQNPRVLNVGDEVRLANLPNVVGFVDGFGNGMITVVTSDGAKVLSPRNKLIKITRNQ